MSIQLDGQKNSNSIKLVAQAWIFRENIGVPVLSFSHSHVREHLVLMIPVNSVS